MSKNVDDLGRGDLEDWLTCVCMCVCGGGSFTCTHQMVPGMSPHKTVGKVNLAQNRFSSRFQKYNKRTSLSPYLPGLASAVEQNIFRNILKIFQFERNILFYCSIV